MQFVDSEVPIYLLFCENKLGAVSVLYPTALSIPEGRVNEAGRISGDVFTPPTLALR